ncbi:MAG: glycosyltransferase [Weeksellaceae bacterium]
MPTPSEIPPNGLSIVVPVLNEAGNITTLLQRIHASVASTKLKYEVIMIDDHSTDGTKEEILKNIKKYPVRYYEKLGSKGKAQSLMEGFAHAKYEIICMIDSDLQYPPEALPEMLAKMKDGYDVVVTHRKEKHTSAIRKMTSNSFNFVFCRLLHDLPYDVQSGLKIFRKEIIERIDIKPLSWSFDLEFLVAARSAGYYISSVDIVFNKRENGASKVDLLWTSMQIGLSAILLKLQPEKIIPFHHAKQKLIGQGFHYKNKEFVHFSDLHAHESAVVTFFAHQILFFAVALIVFILGLILNWKITVLIFMGLITVIYFLDLLFNLFLIIKSLVKSPEITVTEEEIAAVKEWPLYTIFCPLYKEWQVVQHFVEAIGKMDYPKDKLQVQLLLEEDDTETINHVKEYKLPSYFQVIIVPDTKPKTKPKACNYGLKFATGEYAVIYDAEDIPDVLQLKKAVIAFAKADPSIACIQAKLNYYNRSQNLLTRMFTAEYSLWFDLILTGLQSFNAPIPLGGTSNHFKVERLREVKGWDSFNVTEDCDLGIRLAKRGYRTAIVDSDTLEEANSDVMNWINQRSRWIKGYMQTYLVHMRDPRQLFQGALKEHFFTFQLVVGGKIMSLFINPIMWATTILYFALRSILGPVIEQFFPSVIFYLAVFSLVFGNFLYMYYYMIGCAKRKQYDLIKFVYLIPIYWLGMSIAAWKALVQLIIKPHYWQKTQHGLHLKNDTVTAAVQAQTIDIPQQYSGVGLTGRIQKLFFSGGILIIASVFANILNYLYNAYLTRNVELAEFGVISLIGNFLFLTVIPLESLSSSIIYRSAYYLGKFHKPLTELWNRIRSKALILSLIIASIWVISVPSIAQFFNTSNLLPFYLFTPVWIFNTLLAVDMGFLTGNHRFSAIATIALLTPVVKMIATIALVRTGNEALIYAAIPLSIVVSSFIAFILVRMLPKAKLVAEADAKMLSFPNRYFWATALTRFSLVSYLALDILLVKHFLPPTEAGQYAVIALVGKMIFFIGGLFQQLIVPFVSRDLGEGDNKQASFKLIFFASVFSSWVAYVIFGIFGQITGPILLGDGIKDVAYLLPFYGLGVFAFSVASSIISYHVIKKSYVLPVSTFILSIIQIIAISLIHPNLEEIVMTMTGIGIANLIVTLLLHYFNDTITSIARNFVDFVQLLIPLPKEKSAATDKMNILMFNWRDTKHVWAGGAETYVQGMAAEFVKTGHRVTIFCGNDGHSKRYEVIDGVQIIRRGGFFTVYIWAFLYYILRLRGKFDIIIESVNGVPFFTPLYTRIPKVAVIHHIHQEVFREHLPTPLAVIACFLEAQLMPRFYRNTQIVTVSQSTKNSLDKIGFHNDDAVIVYPGIDIADYKTQKKTKKPSILYLGRLKKYKSIDVVIEAMTDIIKKYPDARLTIAGFGEYQTQLEDLTFKLGLEDFIDFTGKVNEKKKNALLAESWVFVQPSFMEGWGITVIEANASGTAVIASDVPGLRDSVRDEKTGFLIRYRDVNGFAEAMIKVIGDSKLRTQLEKNGTQWAKNFTWEMSARKMLEVVKKQL